MTHKELLEKAACWFRCIAQNAHNITVGNVSHSKPKLIEMDAEKAYRAIEEHLNDMQIVYVVTRCEEHADYVVRVFTEKEDAEIFCKERKNDVEEYSLDITETMLV